LQATEQHSQKSLIGRILQPRRNYCGFLSALAWVGAETAFNCCRFARKDATKYEYASVAPVWEVWRCAVQVAPECGKMNTAPVDIYNSFFGFTERPFTLVPDPDFIFWSKAHRLAYTMLEYGVLTRSPITVITGEIGAGKTTLLQHLLKTLPEEVIVGLISNAQGDRGELLQWVLHSLGVSFDPSASYVILFQRLQEYLVDSYADGHRVILIIDEAQNLNVNTLEELRMLTNINSNKDELVQLVLVGQPELRALIMRPELKQFVQRVGSSFHLSAMNRENVAAYVAHRLRVAGGSGREFSEAALTKVFELTGGVPRLVNQLCDLGLVYAFSAEEHMVTDDTIDSVLSDGVFFGAASLNGGQAHEV
jgi:type II secretory pathway predicted ATPase ExeA